MHASSVEAAATTRVAPKKARPATPRKRAPTVRPPVEQHDPLPSASLIVDESPTAELAVFDDLIVFDEPMIEKAAPINVDPEEKDFFDDLDFEKRVAAKPVARPKRVEARVPYVMPTIVPAEPDPEPEPVVDPLDNEQPTGLVPTAEPALERQPANLKLKLKTSLKPRFTRAARSTKSLARSLQPVVLARHRPRVRRVTRVVRHIDTWSVFKIAVLFNIFLYAVCLTAGVMLWRVALNTGTIENIERFFESFGWQTFELKGGEIYHNAWIAGLFGIVGLTGLAVLAATMFNLITDLVGGVRVTVLEEEVTAREPHVVTWPRLLRPASPPRTDPIQHQTGEPPTN